MGRGSLWGTENAGAKLGTGSRSAANARRTGTGARRSWTWAQHGQTSSTSVSCLQGEDASGQEGVGSRMGTQSSFFRHTNKYRSRLQRQRKSKHFKWFTLCSAWFSGVSVRWVACHGSGLRLRWLCFDFLIQSKALGSSTRVGSSRPYWRTSKKHIDTRLAIRGGFHATTPLQPPTAQKPFSPPTKTEERSMASSRVEAERWTEPTTDPYRRWAREFGKQASGKIERPGEMWRRRIGRSLRKEYEKGEWCGCGGWWLLQGERPLVRWIIVAPHQKNSWAKLPAFVSTCGWGRGNAPDAGSQQFGSLGGHCHQVLLGAILHHFRWQMLRYIQRLCLGWWCRIVELTCGTSIGAQELGVWRFAAWLRWWKLRRGREAFFRHPHPCHLDPTLRKIPFQAAL